MAPGRIKRRGPPLGNQNARKHGFYSSVLLPAQQALLPRAKSIKGLNDEIGVARIRLAAVVSSAPDNARVLSAAINSLLRLERTKQSIPLAVAPPTPAPPSSARRAVAHPVVDVIA